MPISLIKRKATAAKASLISHKSISCAVKPAFSNALRAAGAGPVNIMVGSAPDNAVATMRARGFKPNFLPTSSLPISIKAAPSTIPEELPAV